MGIMESQLRSIIRSTLREVAEPYIKLGSLSASIAGDERYTDYLDVLMDPTTHAVTVVVSSTGAAGGMDGRGGITGRIEEFRKMTRPNPKPAEIMRLIKEPIANDRQFNFKRYGKASKEFIWTFSYSARDRGLTPANLLQALSWASGRK